MIISCHNHNQWDDSGVFILPPSSLVYLVPSVMTSEKMLIALKGSDTFHQHHFIFLITFNASVLQRELDAPNPTPNQSTRLTLPKQGATLKLLKNDRQIVKRNMEKLSPCHAEKWENYSKKSIENQSLNKFDKKHNKLTFHQEKRFREFCQQASTWNTYFDP